MQLAGTFSYGIYLLHFPTIDFLRGSLRTIEPRKRWIESESGAGVIAQPNEEGIALSVLPLSHVFERQAMYMYLHQGMAVYFAESLLTIGPNLREVRPTIFVGVPRIFEKIYGRVKEKTAEKGRVNEVARVIEHHDHHHDAA